MVWGSRETNTWRAEQRRRGPTSFHYWESKKEGGVRGDNHYIPTKGVGVATMTTDTKSAK